MARTSKTDSVKAGTYREFSYRDLKQNPQNPRRLFDRQPLDILKESIWANGILVPLTVYKDERARQHYILDGERRWRCAEEIETDKEHPRKVVIPANVVDPPTPVANILWMFNIHNLREQWELMPTALSLEVLMSKLGEADEKKLSDLTKLTPPNVKRCKILLSYPKRYQEMMLRTDSEQRIRANFFIELRPVLDLYMGLPQSVRGGKTRNQLIDHFLDLYKKNKIPSVIHFRRVMEAHDYIDQDGKKDKLKEDQFLESARALACSDQHTIRQLFDPLTAEDKSGQKAERLCSDFLRQIRSLKVSHISRRAKLRRSLLSIRKYIDDLLTKLEGEG